MYTYKVGESIYLYLTTRKTEAYPLIYSYWDEPLLTPNKIRICNIDI